MESIPRATPRFTRKNWLCLFACLALGGLHAFCSSLFDGYPAGAGRAVFFLAFQLLGLLLCKKQARWHKESIFLTVCSFLLSLAYGIFASETMRFLNLPVLLGATFCMLFSVSGLSEHAVLSAQGLWENFCRAWQTSFAHVFSPFSALYALRRDSKRIQGLGLGIGICLPLTAIVISLLSSADSVFGSMFTALFDQVHTLRLGPVLWQLLKTLAYTLMMFSALHALTQPRKELKAISRPASSPAAAFFLPMSALCAIYGLFIYVQFRYLFGNAETAALRGGYAQYARSGFFELVAVTVINLLCILPALTLRGDHKPLRLLCVLLTAETGVILFSALQRMRLYIAVYGLTHLRLLTLWAMAMIAAALIFSLLKAAKPSRRICAVMTVIVLSSWILLNYANVDAIIAGYNIRVMPPDQLDISYLGSLSPDALPAMKKLDEVTLLQIKERMTQYNGLPPLYNSSLTWLMY